MSDKYRRWLIQETPEWVRAGIVSAETAERLHAYYGITGELAGRRWAVVIFVFSGNNCSKLVSDHVNMVKINFVPGFSLSSGSHTHIGRFAHGWNF